VREAVGGVTRTRLYLTAFLVGLAVLFGGASKAEPHPCVVVRC
jgi:hypothetical protein